MVTRKELDEVKKSISELAEDIEAIKLALQSLESHRIDMAADIKSLKGKKPKDYNSEIRGVKDSVANLEQRVNELAEEGFISPVRFRNEKVIEDGFANMMSYDPFRKEE